MKQYDIERFNFLVRHITDYENLENGFAGKCADINYKFLYEAKDIFSSKITLAMGWIEINGVAIFKPNKTGEVKHHADDKTPRLEYHVWLEEDGKLLDLTIIDTLRDKDNFDDSIIPTTLSYVTNDSATALNIKYHSEQLGDGILENYKC